MQAWCYNRMIERETNKQTLSLVHSTDSLEDYPPPPGRGSPLKTECPHPLPGPGSWTVHSCNPHGQISSGPHPLHRQLPWDPQPPLEMNHEEHNGAVQRVASACSSAGLPDRIGTENSLERQSLSLESQGEVHSFQGGQRPCIRLGVRNLSLPLMQTLPQ